MDNKLNEHRARIIKAMAHPSRLAIIEALAQGERCVCELQEIVGSDISTVSKHLSVLKQAGIISDRKVGLQVFYKLRAPCILVFLKCIDELAKQGARETLAIIQAITENR